MGQCEICGREISGGALFTCSYCDGTFCPEHRLPFNHACPNIAQWRRSGSSRRPAATKKGKTLGLAVPLSQKQLITAVFVVLFVLIVLVAAIRPF